NCQQNEAVGEHPNQIVQRSFLASEGASSEKDPVKAFDEKRQGKVKEEAVTAVAPETQEEQTCDRRSQGNCTNNEFVHPETPYASSQIRPYNSRTMAQREAVRRHA